MKGFYVKPHRMSNHIFEKVCRLNRSTQGIAKRPLYFAQYFAHAELNQVNSSDLQ
jgi:hypothetical protein